MNIQLPCLLEIRDPRFAVHSSPYDLEWFPSFSLFLLLTIESVTYNRDTEDEQTIYTYELVAPDGRLVVLWDTPTIEHYIEYCDWKIVK